MAEKLPRECMKCHQVLKKEYMYWISVDPDIKPVYLCIVCVSEIFWEKHDE